jgi:hypothetical protein
MAALAGDFFAGFHEVLEGLNWAEYRAEALRLDPARVQSRVERHLASVESLLGVRLEGRVLILGAFTAMDGFARYEPTGHTVFLGVDESHGRGQYLDVLITHELTHVARETRPETWVGWGLPPRMSRHEFLENMPVVEHLMNEGFSCVVSELLIPGEGPWAYAYQTEDSLQAVLQHGPALDRGIRAELRLPPARSDYGNLYSPTQYTPPQPSLAHYVWAWQWVKHLLHDECAGDPRRLLRRCAKDFLDDALRFELRKIT